MIATCCLRDKTGQKVEIFFLVRDQNSYGGVAPQTISVGEIGWAYESGSELRDRYF